MIPVPADALRQVLQACIGPPHYIRELQATMTPAELFPDNPITILLNTYNGWVDAQNATLPAALPDAG